MTITLFYFILFVYNNRHLFVQLYDIKYSYLIQVICMQFKYFSLTLIIYTQLYGFKYSYIMYII